MKVRNIYFLFSILLVMLVMGGPVMAEKEKAERKVPPSEAKDVSPLKVGDVIPDTTLISSDKESVNLSDVVKDKPAIFIFYRGNW